MHLLFEHISTLKGVVLFVGETTKGQKKSPAPAGLIRFIRLASRLRKRRIDIFL